MSRGHGHRLVPREGCGWVLATGMRKTVPFAVCDISGQKMGLLADEEIERKGSKV